MNIELRDGLPFVTLEVFYNELSIVIDNALLDTGSSSTLLSTDVMIGIGMIPEPDDIVHEMVGIGGSEFVLEKRVQRLVLGTAVLEDFPAQIGEMGYGLALDAIIGTDLLLAINAVIDLRSLELSFKATS